MRLNEFLSKLLVPLWNKDQTNEKMKSVGFPVHSSFHMHCSKTAELEYLDHVTVTSGEEMWTDITISHISLIRPLYYVNKPNAHSLVGLSLQIALTQSLIHREYNKYYLNKRKWLVRSEGLLLNAAFFCRLDSSPKPFICSAPLRVYFLMGAGWCQGLALILGHTNIFIFCEYIKNY